MLTRTYLVVGLLTLLHILAWFAVALVEKRNDVADVAWGCGFLIAGLGSFLLNGAAVDRGLLVTGLVSIWALRLSRHIFRRNRGKDEDPRYAAWRREWGRWFVVRSFVQVFILQWVLMLLVSLPVLIVNVRRGGPPTPFDLLGVAVWAFGFVFEAAADRQLRRFTRDPVNRGALLRTGLWRYSRHPNYFGEVVQWWGLALIALSVPGGVWGTVGAAVITLLILKVSGIPLLEARLALKPGYADYAATTSAFVPLPPRRR